MANAEVSTPSSEPSCSKRPPDTVVPPPPTPPVDVESVKDAESDGQEERKEEECDVVGSELENKIALHSGSDIFSEGKVVFGEDSSFGKDVLGEEAMVDGHVIKLETVKEEIDLPLVKLDTSTPEQTMGECQVVKLGSERKRKSHEGSKNIESLYDRSGRRLTRSNSRVLTKGVNNCQKVAKRVTRSQKSSPADYLGNDVDILGIERALKRLSRSGSKWVLQEPSAGNSPLNSPPPEKINDCIMLDLPDSDGSSDMVSRGVTIIEEIMVTTQEDETKPISVESPIQERVNLDCPSDELNSNIVSPEADETIKDANETDAVCASEESVLFGELIREEPMPGNKDTEQNTVIPMEICATTVEVSCAEKKLENSRLETPSKRLTRSALRNAQMEESFIHETKGAEQNIVLRMEECPGTVEVSSDGNKFDSSKLVSSSKRFTRSSLKNEHLDASRISDFGPSMDEPTLKNQNLEEQETVVPEDLNSNSVDKSSDVVKVEKCGLEVPARRFTRSALKSAQMDVTPFLGFKSTIDEPISECQDAKKVEVTQVSIDGSSYSNTNKLENTEFETPPKRVTRSAVKNTQIASTRFESPPRRFTRSLLKSNLNYDEDDGAGDGVDFSEPERVTRKVSCSSQKGNKLDRRPTMSSGCKKFDLIKPPSNARELLATGFLEGLDVMYIVPHSKKPVLKGVIKGSNILCFCSACKGFQHVSAYNFEVHAGSTKKHPSEFIFLENGNTLRDILRVCFSARINDLEAALRNEVSPVPKKNLRACLKCGSLLTSAVHKFFLCDSCSETNQLQPPCDGSMIQSPVTTQRLPIPAPSQSPAEMLSKGVPSSTLSLSSAKKTNTVGRLTRKNTGLHKLVFMGDILPDGTEVAYYVGGKRLVDGYIKDGAIFCHCCSAVVSPSQFEAHAGQASRRKPYNNIYTSNGVSLHELSVSLSKHKMVSLGETDDLCSMCSQSGDLIVCDICPRAFHKECVGLTEIPEGDWYCQFCVSLHRRDNCVASNDNARAAGRVEGVDPIDQIIKRCIRIVSISETDLGGCTICKLHDFSQSGFDDRTVILCDQCQREYHVGCLRDCKVADLKELPEEDWFCSSDCSTMHVALKEIILGGPRSLTSSDIELIRSKSEEKCASDNENEKKKEIVDYDDIRWRLLSGAIAQEVEAQLLSGAVSIFHESFDPIIDAKTKKDLIPDMVNGMSTDGHQDYSGMYCAVLTVGSKVVSAGLLRVFGTDAAELPLVATSRDLQGLGYFQALFGCMERMLIDLKIRHFLLPAAEEAESIWTKKFGFSRISSDQVDEYLKGAHLTAFRGTASLHKPLFIS